MNKCVIFDLDGTLLESVPDILKYVNLTMDYFGYNHISRYDCSRFVGNGAGKLIERSVNKSLGQNKTLSQEEYATILAYYNKIYTASNSELTYIFDGMDEVLVALKKRGYKLAILTNKPQQTTDKIVNKLLSKYNFDKVVGPHDNIKTKPDKTTTLQILNELDVDIDNAYFVGDGETDVLTAINAGVHGIAVLWGYREKQELADAGATVFATKPSDLLKLIK